MLHIWINVISYDLTKDTILFQLICAQIWRYSKVQTNNCTEVYCITVAHLPPAGYVCVSLEGGFISSRNSCACWHLVGDHRALHMCAGCVSMSVSMQADWHHGSLKKWDVYLLRWSRKHRPTLQKPLIHLRGQSWLMILAEMNICFTFRAEC